LIANLSEPIERFHLTINFMIDPPITGGSSPFGGLLPSYCLVVVGEAIFNCQVIPYVYLRC